VTVRRWRAAARWCFLICVVGAEAEDVVNFEDDGAGFALVELAFGIFELLEHGTGTGTGLAVLLKQHGFFTGASERVEEPGKSGGIAAEFLVEAAGPEIAEGLEDVKSAKLEGGMIEVGGVEIAAEVFSSFLTGAGAGDKGLFGEPILVATFFPLGEVTRFEAGAGGTEAGYDLRVGDAVEDPLVDLVTDGFGEASDFAVGASMAGGFR